MNKIMTLLMAYSLFAGSAYGRDNTGDFDYYAMALSWSPEYCAVKPSDKEQCSRQLGFVLHGLWPQYEQGYPSSCSNERFASKMEREFAGLYPSHSLYRHEWEKHGTCSGLSQQQYHQLASDLRQKIKVPVLFQSPEKPIRTTLSALKAQMIEANPWLSANSITVACNNGGRFLKEIYICLNKDGHDDVSCSAEMQKRERRSCRQNDFLMRSQR